MFASHEVIVEAPMESALGRLTHLINRGHLRGMSDSTYQGGLEMITRVGPFGDVPGLSKSVRVQVLPPLRTATGTMVAIRWEATGPGGDLFPVLDADLILTADGDQRCRLELLGSYRPPLGAVGAVLDRKVMTRVTHATFRRLLKQIVAYISAPAPEVELRTAPAEGLDLADEGAG